MNNLTAQWWSACTEDTRRIVLAEYGIYPHNKLGRECFSYGLVNTNLPAFAQRVVDSAFRVRCLFDPVVMQHEELLAGLVGERAHSRIAEANGNPVRWTYNADGSMAKVTE